MQNRPFNDCDEGETNVKIINSYRKFSELIKQGKL